MLRPLSHHLLQLFHGDIESFPSQERHINPPACSESATGPLPGKSRNASHQMCWETTSSCFQFGGVVVLLLNPVSNEHPSCPSEEADFCPLVLIIIIIFFFWSLPRAHGHRWGWECRSTSNSEQLPFHASLALPYKNQRSVHITGDATQTHPHSPVLHKQGPKSPPITGN